MPSLPSQRAGTVSAGVLLCALATLSLSAQTLLGPVRDSGQTVTPVFEGWYRNPDGSFSLSFGYFNRNAKEAVDVPVGAENFMKPGAANQGQPTHFAPRRHWGVFVVKVPADFGDLKKVVWTLTVRGETNAIPGSLRKAWEIDALQGEAGTGNTPPVVKFDPAGPEGRGPGGITAGPLAAVVGQPLPLVLWATDDAKISSSFSTTGRTLLPVTLTWFLHQGPGDVVFSPIAPVTSRTDGKASATATFSVPGAYVLRVRANDYSGVANAGHAQCCWTNGFVRVNVTK